MDYIFYYSGKLPKHVLTSLNAVLSVEDDSKIYFCGSDNSKLDHDRVTFINSKYFFALISLISIFLFFLNLRIFDLKIFFSKKISSTFDNLFLIHLEFLLFYFYLL